MEINWEIAAKIKIFKDRLFNWGVCINLVLLICLNLGVKLGVEHLIFLGCIVVMVAYVDMKYILPREQEYYFRRNPEWQKRNL